MFSVFKNRNFILPLAFILGLSCPALAQYTKPLTIPALALVMTVSLSDIPTHKMFQWKQLSISLMMQQLLYLVLLSVQFMQSI